MTTPNYWQTQVQGQDPQRYTEILSTLTDVDEFFTTYYFGIVIPAGVTTLHLIFTARQVWYWSPSLYVAFNLDV